MSQQPFSSDNGFITTANVAATAINAVNTGVYVGTVKTVPGVKGGPNKLALVSADGIADGTDGSALDITAGSANESEGTPARGGAITIQGGLGTLTTGDIDIARFGGNVRLASAGAFVGVAGDLLVTGETTVTGNVTAANIVLSTGGYINGGVDTIVNDSITSIILGLGAPMEINGAAFATTTRGQLTISGITTTTEANGTWYYQSTNPNAYELYTDGTYTTLVDSTAWTPYTSGDGLVAITEQNSPANVIINANGFLTTFTNSGNLDLSGGGSNINNVFAIINGTSTLGFSGADGNIVGTLGGVYGLEVTTSSVSIGYAAGVITQGANAIALGTNAGFRNQGAEAVSIGAGAGNWFQSAGAVSIGGDDVNETTQGVNAVSVGYGAGTGTQGANAVAIGAFAGTGSQSANAVAIGTIAGGTSQGVDTIAIGQQAGNNNQNANSIAVGAFAGTSFQAGDAVAIGVNAASFNQGIAAVAIGGLAGTYNQANGAVALGGNAAYSNQGTEAIAIGLNAGSGFQGNTAIAVGYNAGSLNQGIATVALGLNAGATAQGGNAVALGAYAGSTNQPANSIMINASGTALNGLNEGLYINPIRNDAGNSVNAVYYNTSTNEVTYSAPQLWFKGTLATAQTLTTGGDTIILWDANTDPQGWGNTTSGEITPNRPGWYEIISRAEFSAVAGNASAQVNHQILINGVQQAISQNPDGTALGAGVSVTTTAMVELNGTTDYITTSCYTTLATQDLVGGNYSLLLVKWISS